MNAWIADPKEKKISDVWIAGEDIPEGHILVFSLFELYKTSFDKTYFKPWCKKTIFEFFDEGKDYFIDHNFRLKKFKQHLRIWITLPTAIYVCGMLKTIQSKQVYEQIISIISKQKTPRSLEFPLRLPPH